MAAFDPLAFLVRFTSIPTAPFCEDRVIREVDAFAKRYRAIRLERDAHGNTLLSRPGKRGKDSPRLVLVAHLDHPGFVAEEMIDETTLRAAFRGHVLASVMKDAKARFFSAKDVETPAKVLSVEADEAGYARSATLKVKGHVEPGSLGMFDVGVGRLSGKRLYSRACDDLAGAASALCTLVEFAKKPADADVCVLLTRGEEDGFIGALASVISPSLLRSTDRIISIETSAEQPVAVQGKGVVLRVGDRTSIFHSAFSRFLFEQATAIGKEDKTFKFQRALMPGGTCEGTVFDAWGYTAAAVCVALGNYHNMDRERGRIAAEHIHIDDWRHMVRLFVQVAKSIHTFDGTHSATKARLTKLYESKRALL